MKDFFESFFDTLKTRYKNKFIGTFFLVYLGLNWEKVSSFIFISEFKYQEFIDIWTDSSATFWMTVFWAFVISLTYLIASPWISYAIHWTQSYAITKYKVQSIINQIALNEKTLELQLIKNKLVKLKNESNRDFIRFKKITESIDQVDTGGYLIDLSDIDQRSKFTATVKKVITTLTAENAFDNNDLSVLADELETKAVAVINFINNNRLEMILANPELVDGLKKVIFELREASLKFSKQGEAILKI